MHTQIRRLTTLTGLLVGLGCGEAASPPTAASPGGTAGTPPSGGASGTGGATEGGTPMTEGGSSSGATAATGATGNGGSTGGEGGRGGGSAGGSGGAGNTLLPAPTGLLCELLRHPEQTTITDPRPEFGFVVGSRQLSAHRILVASSRSKLDGDEGDLWDTGKRESTQSVDIEYAGTSLQPSKTYFWKVKTWGEEGAESAWSEVQSFVMAASVGAYTTPRHAIQQTPVAPAKVTALASDHVFVDFGRDAFGWLELELDAPKAATLTIRLGEQAQNNAVNLSPGGSIRAATVTLAVQAGAKKYRVETPKDSRNTSGDAIRLPAALGVVMPFRYVEISGAPMPLEASMIKQISVHYPHDATASEFLSSSESLNRIWDMSKYSMIAPTFAGIYIDGDRERIPYEGDAYIQQLGHYSIDREFAIARYSHEYLLSHPTWPTEWKQHSVMMAWADWMYTGNTEALANAYDVLVSQKTLESHVRDDGLLSSVGLEDLVDWPEGERDGHVFADVNTVVNAFFCKNLRQMSELARALGKDADATRYSAMADKATAALNQKLVNASTGLYVDGLGVTHSSLHSNMFALAFGLVPAERRAKVVTFVKSRGMACSVYGAQYLLEALYEGGEEQAALALLTAETDRSWMNMLKVGATIAMEAWDAKYKPNLDWNHAWGAAPANILPRYMLGVRPLTPGFGKVEIRPRPASLTSVAGTIPTIRGPVAVKWQASVPTKPELDVTLPGNMLADVALPAALSACSPLVDGQPASVTVRDGVSWLENLGAGSHHLACP